MGQGPQKPEHNGNFIMVPRRVLDSVAWRHASLRARVVLMIFQRRHKGKDNGHLALSLTELCEAVGDQNRSANSKAVAELIDLGFLECTSGADHAFAKAREYRITFIPTGEGKSAKAATHEYEDWRPSGVKTRKFRGTINAPENMKTGAINAPRLKISGAINAPRPTENQGVQVPDRGAINALPLSNHLSGTVEGVSRLANSSSSSRSPRAAEPITVDPDELRAWAQAVVQLLGNARPLARDANMPEPALSRFRAGKSLPTRYHLPLQMACGRALPFIKYKAATA